MVTGHATPQKSAMKIKKQKNDTHIIISDCDELRVILNICLVNGGHTKGCHKTCNGWYLQSMALVFHCWVTDSI